MTVVVLEAEVEQGLLHRLSDVMAERYVVVTPRREGRGLEFISKQVPDLWQAFALMEWVIATASAEGLDDALVVQACAYSTSAWWALEGP